MVYIDDTCPQRAGRKSIGGGYTGPCVSASLPFLKEVE
jgi:hypothetical protein